MNRLLKFSVVAATIVLVTTNASNAQRRLQRLRPLTRQSIVRNPNTQDRKTRQQPRQQQAANRFGSGVLTPTGGLPDLIVTSIRSQGSSISVSVKNAGIQFASPNRLRITVRRVGSNTQLAQKTLVVNQIAANQSKTILFRGVPNSNVNVTAFVDPDGQIRERTEGNNTRTVRLTSQSTRTPDLAIGRVLRTANGLSVVVANLGNGGTGRTDVTIAVRRKSDLTTILRQTLAVTPLNPGRSATVQVVAPELNNTDVFVTADNGRRLRESNEGNNTRVVSYGL